MSEDTDRSERTCATGLSVLWLAEDELSYLGLPLMLEKVPTIAHFRVEQFDPAAIRLSTSGAYDVAVVPLRRYPEVPTKDAMPQTRTKVLVSLAEIDARAVRSVAWRHPVCGFVPRRDLTVTGLSAIFARLVAGEFPVPPSLARDLLTADRPRPRAVDTPKARHLTEREHIVLTQLLKGLSNHQIARAMEISVHGVKRHVSNLLVKFDCSNRTEVALAAARLGMDSPL
jgi:DNA-binding NarL/FixJ family response regulator